MQTRLERVFRNFAGRVSGPTSDNLPPDSTNRPATPAFMRPYTPDQRAPVDGEQANMTPPRSPDVALLIDAMSQNILEPAPSVPEERAKPADSEPETLPSPLHALIIGIDEYQSGDIYSLKGAVSDANAMYEYLRTELQVPERQIVNLRNEGATRDAIIRHIAGFPKRETIRSGDPILIYFAGHGSTSTAPEDWYIGRQSISLIVPYDTCGELYDEDLAKHAIPDRTIGALLHELAEDGRGIGDNITVIFDCCHSGSGTRGGQGHSSRRARCVNLSGRIPADLDKDIWSKVPLNRGARVAAGFAHSGTKSHVLLAACRANEYAYEGDDRGFFTHKLIATLRTIPMDKTTYRGLMQHIVDIPGQTPQCEGHNTDRFLFDAQVPCKRRTLYDLDVLPDKSIVIRVGSVHGVAQDTEFAVYRSPHPDTTDMPLALLTPKEVNAFTTIVASHPSFPLGIQSCFALPSSMSAPDALRLHFSSEDVGSRPIKGALEKAYQFQRRFGEPSISIEEVETNAHFSIRTRGGRATYTILETSIPSLPRYELTETTQADPRSIQPVLSAAAHFFWHLLRSPKKNELRDGIDIGVYELKEDLGANLGPDRLRPWIARDSNLNIFDKGFVDVIADDNTPYGIVVRNTFDSPLHVWAFYFDYSTLSISEYYKPPAIGDGAEPSLPPKGELTIGYGAGGGQPYTFVLQEGQDLDVGFIKLFISSEYVNLSSIEQLSPFTPHRAPHQKKAKPAAIWDTVMIAVIQHKPRSKLSPG